MKPAFYIRVQSSYKTSAIYPCTVILQKPAPYIRVQSSYRNLRHISVYSHHTEICAIYQCKVILQKMLLMFYNCVEVFCLLGLCRMRVRMDSYVLTESVLCLLLGLWLWRPVFACVSGCWLRPQCRPLFGSQLLQASLFPVSTTFAHDPIIVLYATDYVDDCGADITADRILGCADH